MRARLSDLSQSRLPQALGNCAGNLPAIASYVNEVTQRLLSTFGETGPIGAFVKIVVNVPRADPYLSLPAQFARVISADICRSPTFINNEFWETLSDGVGLQREPGGVGCNISGIYDRGFRPTAYELPPADNLIRVYFTDARDIGKRVLFSQANDASGNGIYSQDGVARVNGFYLTLESPFATSAFVVTKVNAISKDVTYGDVVIKAVNQNTGEETLLARPTPGETNLEYRRYFLAGIPCGCCANPANATQMQVAAIVKLEYRPVSQPSDQLIIGNIPALKLACESVRLSEMDNPTAQQMSLLKWNQAVQMLNQEIVHYLGDEPAVTVSFGYGQGLRRDMAGFW